MKGTNVDLIDILNTFFKKENAHSKFVMYNEILDASNKKLYEEKMLKEFKKLQDKPNE